MKKIAVVIACVAVAKLESSACFIHSPLPVELIEDHITIDVTEQIAVKTYTCTFYNPNNQAVVGGTCYMEVEPGAQVDNLKLKLGDQEVQADILDAEKAKKVFQEIVAKGGSPALLEFYGNGLIKADVPKIPPGGTVTAVLRYTTIVKGDNGLYRLQVLNTNPKAWLKPLKKVTVKGKIRSQLPIKTIYSPTHNITVVRTNDNEATVSYEQENYLPKQPMVLYWHLAEGEVGLNVLTHRDEDERGTFMLMMTPGLDSKRIRVLPKEIVFCIDTSGSMVEEDRLGQVQKALAHCLERLNPDDRFNVVDFSTEARKFENGLVEATAENRKRALEYVRKFTARGGTAIEDALDQSLGQFTAAEAPRMLVFLTDGAPNIGESDPEKLVAMSKKKNPHAARLFVFGVGNDVNAKLLDRLAEENGGTSDYFLPKEEITTRLSEFYDRIASPVLTDITIRFEDLKVEELYPRRTPDLFKGKQLILFGRYFADESHGSKKVVVSGRVNGEEISFEYSLHFPANNPGNDFLPRVWAGRKVAYLLDEIRRNGKNQELIDEVIHLAKQHGIVTPYTSFLVTQDVSPGASTEDLRGRLSFGASGSEQKMYRLLSENDGAWGLFEGGVGASGRSETQVMQKMRMIGPKTFYFTDGVWYDSAYDPKKHPSPTVLKVQSDDCTKLIQDKPAIARYLSLGTVVVVYQGKAYRVEG